MEFQVLAVSLIHGSTDWAPPPLKLVWQEYMLPTSGEVERFPSPRGMELGFTGFIEFGILLEVAAKEKAATDEKDKRKRINATSSDLKFNTRKNSCICYKVLSNHSSKLCTFRVPLSFFRLR